MSIAPQALLPFMHNALRHIIILASVLFCVVAWVTEIRAITFADGQVHVIDQFRPLDDFIVEDGPSGPTTIRVIAGGAVRNIEVRGFSRVNVLDGGQVEQINAFEDAVVDISGGMFLRQQFLNDRSTLRVSGGSFAAEIFLARFTTTFISGGSIGGISASGGNCEITGGSFSGQVTFSCDIRITGGTFSRVHLNPDSLNVAAKEISGGEFQGGIRPYTNICDTRGKVAL